MLSRLRRWRRQRIVEARRPSPHDWEAATAGLPVLSGLSPAERARLQELAVLFLHAKSLEPVAGLELTEPMRLRIAALAALPVLGLDIDYYRGFYSVVIYPGSFRARHEHWEEDGTVHQVEQELAGEAWERGPVILSWEEVEASLELDGFNVVIHECAHKLDMLTGATNGLPPLHRGMQVRAWSEAFGAAYENLQRRAQAGEQTELDPYAAESPAEFFAVASEAFFELPHLLREVYPAVYEQLLAFYRQDPASRLPEDC